jgi:hypothetical protein
MKFVLRRDEKWHCLALFGAREWDGDAGFAVVLRVFFVERKSARIASLRCTGRMPVGRVEDRFAPKHGRVARATWEIAWLLARGTAADTGGPPVPLLGCLLTDAGGVSGFPNLLRM